MDMTKQGKRIKVKLNLTGCTMHSFRGAALTCSDPHAAATGGVGAHPCNPGPVLAADANQAAQPVVACRGKGAQVGQPAAQQPMGISSSLTLQLWQLAAGCW